MRNSWSCKPSLVDVITVKSDILRKGMEVTKCGRGRATVGWAASGRVREPFRSALGCRVWALKERMAGISTREN